MKLLNNYKLWMIIFLNVILSSYAFTQTSPIKWGEIPKADLEMKSFPQDTNASALILCDFGESHFNDEVDVIHNRHSRIKIFTTKGYNWATFSITLHTEDKVESISNIKGATYNLDDKGEMVTTLLSEKDIYKEKVDDQRTRYRFTLPGIKPGCIIELQYTITATNPILIRDWIFQHDEPVRRSEYLIRFPHCYGYSIYHHGFFPYTIQEIKDTNIIVQGFAWKLYRSSTLPSRQAHWVVENIPAMREEPFITTTDDYIKRIEIQLSEYPNYRTGRIEHYLTDWKTYVDKLIEADWFFKKIDVTRKVKKQAEEIILSLSSPKEKMKAIYNWVKNSIVFTKSNSRYAGQEVNETLELKKGNCADITFLLLSLLQSVGIPGDPIILSTRDNGKIQQAYPIETQFNYVLARVQLDTVNYYLDATDPLRPFELLPVKVLNTTGLVVKKDTVEWVAITSPKCQLVNSIANLTLHDDGSLTGTFYDSRQDYGSLFMRHDLENKKDIDIAKEHFNAERMDIVIDSVKLEARDSISLPLILRAWISSPSYAQLNGDLIYINPQILNRTSENPFKTEKREFPIDYGYERNQTTVINITIPEGFEVKERLNNRKLMIGQKFLWYTRDVQIDSNFIQVISKFVVQNTEIEPKHYPRLKEIYGQMVSLESEQFVLARKKNLKDVSKKALPAKQIQKKGSK